MEIRTATLADLDQIAAVEKACFPPAEAASVDSFRERLMVYPNHFHLMFCGPKLISFVDGFVTDEADLTDEMFADASLHNESGRWQMLFGVNTLPEYRRNGYAGQLIREMIRTAREEGRAGVVLTCKDRLLHYYATFGFIGEGPTDKSSHGGAKWNQMRITF
ncbi:MAG: GNAT family N-acetyltransferase [Clostridia bacterium]|nr:GNAT family N-acetyltransferase [Clostridia bacterium]